MAADRRKVWMKVLMAVGACLLLYSLVSMLVVRIIYEQQFGRAERPSYTMDLRYGDVAARYPRQEVSFPSGGNMLAGYLYGAEHDRGLLVLAHGIGGGADSYLAEITHFVDEGWRLFAYDCTGSYDSEGKGTRGLPQSARDLHAALTYLEAQEENRDLPVVLYGHSWGGYAVTAVLDKGHDVAAAVSVAGYDEPMRMLLEWTRRTAGGFAYAQYPFLWAYQTLLFGSDAWHTALDGINSGDVPVLILHGVADDVVTYGGTGIIAQRDRITNPNVEYATYDVAGQDGHSSLFLSVGAMAYREDAWQLYWELLQTEPDDEQKLAFYAEIDRELASRLNPAFTAEVDAFLRRVVVE